MTAVDGLLIGQNVKLTFTDINGNYNFAILESFRGMETPTILSETSIDSQFRVIKLPKGWSGTFIVQQNNDVINQYFSDFEAGFYAGADQVNMTITETITYQGGVQAQYQYRGCVLTLSDGGEYSGQAIKKQTVSFTASRWQRIL